MAEKLTAQQKRDREYANLISDLRREWELEQADRENKLFTLAFEQGYEQASSVYQRLSLWSRIRKVTL